MINNEVIAGVATGALIAILLPFVLFFALRRRFDLRGWNVFIGAIVFVVMVVVLEAALHVYVLKLNPVTKAWFDANGYAFAVYAALAAAVFEETGRYIALRFFARPVPGSGTPIAYGLGHGGAEAVLIGLNIGIIAVLGYLVSTGQLDTLHLDAKSADAIKSAVAGLKDATFFQSLLGGLERISAIILQLGLSFIVWHAVTTRRIAFYFLAVAFHFAFDFPAALVQRKLLPLTGIDVEVGYGALALIVLAAIWAFAPRTQATRA